MNSNGCIRVTNLGKAYRQYTNRRSRLAEWILPFQESRYKLRWVLQGINFSIEPGEAVGIIGSNGAGKSTLLKLITGTTTPTTGEIALTGRVAALLELGMGFHPDFTGRQNAFMAGQLIGLRVDEITALMPHIEAFAEIGDYIDQPVRIYSSGMMVRLAFSVATAARPAILVIDEALSVGDAYFQHKSFDRIRQFRDSGTTLLFVSHNAGAIKTLCNRAILIDKGMVLRDDAPDAVTDYYNAIVAKQSAEYEIHQTEQRTGRRITRSGTQEANIETVDLLVNNKSVRAVTSGDGAKVRIVANIHAPIDELTVGILIRDRLGNDVFGTNTFHHKISLEKLDGRCQALIDFAFPALQLGLGSYSLTIALHKGHNHLAANYDWWDRALVFQIVPGNVPQSIGVYNIPVSIEYQLSPASDEETRNRPMIW